MEDEDKETSIIEENKTPLGNATATKEPNKMIWFVLGLAVVVGVTAIGSVVVKLRKQKEQ